MEHAYLKDIIIMYMYGISWLHTYTLGPWLQVISIPIAEPATAETKEPNAVGLFANSSEMSGI